MNISDGGALASCDPRPDIRLGLAVALGLLGAWLMPVKSESIITGQLTGQHGPALLVWLAVAFTGVTVLQRVEHVQMVSRLPVVMGLTLVLALVRSPSVHMYYTLDTWGLVKMGAIGLLVLVTGASVFVVSFQRGTSRPWLDSVIRGAALAIASPLILFALRPRSGGPFSAKSALSTTGFVILPLALACQALPLGLIDYPRIVWDYVDMHKLELMCESFGCWAWLGCAVLFLLTPWPETPQLETTNRPTMARKSTTLAVLGLLGIALILLATLERSECIRMIWYGFGILYLNLLAIALLVMLSPWFRYPHLPMLSEPEPEAKLGPIGTALLLALTLVPVASYCQGYLIAVISGSLFASRFDHSWLGWALDQSTVQSGFWRLGYIGVGVLSQVAVARWLSDRSTRWGYWAFTAPTVALFVYLLSYLTVTFYCLLAYIHALGYTPLRIYGLVYGIGCYLFMMGFLGWAVQGRKAEGKPRESVDK